MEITVEMSGKTPRSYGGRTKWGVHPVGSPKDYWIDIYYAERPKAGQVFNIGAVKETVSKDGAKVFREAEIIGTSSPEARRPIAQPQQSHHAPLTNNPPAPSTNGSVAPSYTPNGKIKWQEWAEVAQTAWSYGINIIGMPSEQCIGFVQTTLVALRDGKLELPAEREPGDDSDAYRNPDSVISPWDQK